MNATTPMNTGDSHEHEEEENKPHFGGHIRVLYKA